MNNFFVRQTNFSFIVFKAQKRHFSDRPFVRNTECLSLPGALFQMRPTTSATTDLLFLYILIIGYIFQAIFTRICGSPPPKKVKILKKSGDLWRPFGNFYIRFKALRAP